MRKPNRYWSKHRLERLRVVSEALRNGGANATSIAHDLNVTPKTIHRDLDILKTEYDHDFTWDHGTNSYKWIDGPKCKCFLIKTTEEPTENTDHLDVAIQDLRSLLSSALSLAATLNEAAASIEAELATRKGGRK